MIDTAGGAKRASISGVVTGKAAVVDQELLARRSKSTRKLKAQAVGGDGGLGSSMSLVRARFLILALRVLLFFFLSRTLDLSSR